MIHAFAEWSGREPAVQQFWGECVGRFLDLIAGARVALHAHAEGAQFLHPVPDGGARDADFAGDFCAADDEHGIVSEQGKKGIDAAVGDAR